MISLPFPAKALWPNGRAHWAAKSRETKKHREWARLATLADTTRPAKVGRLVVTIYPKAKGPLPDRDNAVAAMKAYQDGIASAYRCDDRWFLEPSIQFGERTANGGVSIILEDVHA